MDLLADHGTSWIETVSLSELLSRPSSENNRKHPHKDVLCFQLGTSTIYIKRQWNWDRRLPRWPDWRDGVYRTPDPVREHDGLQRMRSIGLSVPTPLRLLREQSPRSPRAALIMSAVPASRSFTEWIRLGDVGRLDPFARRRLVAALADLSDRLSSNGLRWRSMKAKHIYPVPLANDRWQLWLIDCEGVRSKATGRQQRRDRRVLVKSLLTAGADAAFLSAVESVLLSRRGRPF